MADLYADAADRFRRDTADHEMTVLHGDGLYRHLRFRDPTSSFSWFDLITWPHNLAINGGMGSYAFSRMEDMFEFFRGGDINPGYWAEKLRAAGQDGVKSYSEDRFRQIVTEHVEEADDPALTVAAKEQILDNEGIHYESGAWAALNAFDYADFRFRDIWEWDLRDYTEQFLWCCHAIRWGIAQYDAAKAVAPNG